MGIYVLAAHRSGTSAVAGALSALTGLSASRDASVSNPSGHWERSELRPALELLLAWNRATWFRPPPEDLVLTLPPGGRGILGRHFAAQCGEAFLWKDPRLCLTIDHWLTYPQAEPQIVVVYRDPRAVARSLAARNELQPSHALAIWERTTRNLVRRLRGREVVVVRYSELVEDPRSWLEELCGWLKVNPDSAVVEAALGTVGQPTASHADVSGFSLTAEQLWLDQELGAHRGIARLDFGAVGSESGTTAELLGSSTVPELLRQCVRGFRVGWRPEAPQIAGSNE